MPPIDGLCSSVRRAVIVITAGPADVSTVVGVMASDASTGAFVSTAAALRAIAPNETSATTPRAVTVVAATDRRRRAPTVGTRRNRRSPSRCIGSPIGPKWGRMSPYRPEVDELLRVP